MSPAQSQAFSGHMLFQMAAMSADDGLTMQIHPGVLRDHDRAATHTFGPDKGYDIPVATEYTRALRPVLEAFGHHDRFRLIAFTIDETVFSRELAPWPGLPGDARRRPWWFLDSPDAMRRAREAVTETAGFHNLSGFVDDTRPSARSPPATTSPAASTPPPGPSRRRAPARHRRGARDRGRPRVRAAEGKLPRPRRKDGDERRHHDPQRRGPRHEPRP
ncbi:glucuronate isomerase [Oerskovia sp. M15]